MKGQIKKERTKDSDRLNNRQNIWVGLSLIWRCHGDRRSGGEC